MAGFRGAGKVYINFYDSTGGTWSGPRDMSNIASIAISNSGSSTVTMKSTADTNYGAVIGSSTTPGDDQVTIKLNDPNRKNLTAMMLGTDTDISVTGSTVTDESVSVRKGAFSVLAHRKIASSPAPVVTNSAGSTTYSDTTDYVFDYNNGTIFIPTTSTIADNSTLKIDYTYGSTSGYKVTARTQSNITCKLMFLGKNLDSGEYIRVQADSVELSPDGDFNLISSDNAFLEFTLKGTLKVPTGQTSPYTLEVTS